MFFSFDLSVFLSQNRYVYISSSFRLRTTANESGAWLQTKYRGKKNAARYFENKIFVQFVIFPKYSLRRRCFGSAKVGFDSNITLLISVDFEWFRCRLMNTNNGKSNSYQCKTDLSISFKCQNIEQCWHFTMIAGRWNYGLLHFSLIAKNIPWKLYFPILETM